MEGRVGEHCQVALLKDQLVRHAVVELNTNQLIASVAWWKVADMITGSPIPCQETVQQQSTVPSERLVQ